MNKKVKSLLYFTGFVIAALTHYQTTLHDAPEQNQLAHSTIEKGISIEAIN